MPDNFTLKDGRRVYRKKSRVGIYCEICFRQIFIDEDYVKIPGSGVRHRHWRCYRREVRKNTNE